MAAVLQKRVSNSSYDQADSLKKALTSRFNGLANKALYDLEPADAVALDDIELMRELYIQTLKNHSRITERELRKMQKRAEAERAFFEDLESLGGTLKAKEVSELLGVKRQTVNNRLKSNKLIAIKCGGDYLYPAFQFKDGDTLKYFDEINRCLPDYLDGVARVSFFTCQINDGENDTMTPIDLLSKNNISDDELFRLKRNAKLQGSHIAK